MTGRAWGFWTKEKLDILRRYLDRFTTTTKNRSSERLYLDLFAGVTDNYDRITWDPIEGSARIALKTSNPPFTRLRLFELEDKAGDLEGRLRTDFPGRDIRVVPGDCNTTVHEVLKDLRPFNWAPTFAFIDPNGPDVHWTTLQALAGFKKPGAKKVELWLLFPHAMFVRLLSINEGGRPEFGERVTTMFGTEAWQAIHKARVAERLSPPEARHEYVNLMRWRIENDLGYGWTHALEVFNEAGRPLYDMIFATDHPAGTRIMSHLYDQAAKELPAMRNAARAMRQRIADEEAGVQRLFTDDPAGKPLEEKFYEHLKPTPPYGH